MPLYLEIRRHSVSCGCMEGGTFERRLFSCTGTANREKDLGMSQQIKEESQDSASGDLKKAAL